MLSKKEINKIEKLVDLVCAIDDIPKDDTKRVEEIRMRITEIIKNEIKI